MKKILGLSFLMALAFTSFSQKAAKVVFAEIGGPGLASINYDMRFSKKESGLGFRAGLGGLSIDGTSVLLVPLGLNYITSKDGKNYFELGAGASVVHTNDDYYTDDDPFTSTFGHLNVGYRLQPTNGGFTFRAAINPVFGNGFFWPYYGGISFGYKF